MITGLELVTAVGPSIFETVVAGASKPVDDIAVAEPQDLSFGGAGELVLGIGFDASSAVALVEGCAASGSSGLVLRPALAHEEPVRRAARDLDLTLVALTSDVAWGHTVWMLRGVLDRAAAPGSPAAGDAGVHHDLFTLADTVAGLAGAPVTIEDNRSRVLAYSSGQGVTDDARLSTIVGRRVPPDLVAFFRARGVFRRLAQSNEPFLVSMGPEVKRPRFVVPVRAGDEWLGSIWLVVDAAPPPATVEELRRAASLLALQLLRLRAQADIARRSATERLRTVLTEGRAESSYLERLSLPLRVVALDVGAVGSDPAAQLDVWTATCRRNGWEDPQLADVDGTVYAVLASDGAGSGSWPWMQDLVTEAHAAEPSIRAAAGAGTSSVAGLPGSRLEAAELLRLMRGGRVDGPVQTYDAAWAAITIDQAVRSLDLTALPGPAGSLREHDQGHGTAYVQTLHAWLTHPHDPRRAAAALHIHPNTLRHRMRRLAEVVETDLDDPRERLALQLQLEAILRG